MALKGLAVHLLYMYTVCIVNIITMCFGVMLLLILFLCQLHATCSVG